MWCTRFIFLNICIISFIPTFFGCNVTRNPNHLSNLFLEYTSINGSTVVLTSNSSFQSEQYFSLVHKNGVVGHFPKNICNFRNIIRIDLSQNRISLISNISCLLNLEELDLSENRLMTINNNTLTQLEKLVVLNISRNRITHIDPFSLAGPNLNIQFLNASYNEMTSLDITNIVMSGPFCDRIFSHNQITDLTNVLDQLLDPNNTYGPGMVIISDNPFLAWPDFTKLGVKDLHMLGTMFHFGFDVRGSNFSCDCYMAPFLEIAEEVIQRFWRDYMKVECANPPNLKGKLIIDLVKEGKLELFVCTKDAEENCPVECQCTEQPSKSRFLVDCQGKGLRTLPQNLPNTSYPYELNMCDNLLSVLDTRNYLGKVASLKASNNSLERVESEAVEMLRNASNLSLANNKRLIYYFPKIIQYLPSDSIDLEHTVLFCDCDTLWLSDWLDLRQISSEFIFCETENHGRVKAINLQGLLLSECQDSPITSAIVSISLATAVILLGVPSFLIYNFKYELTILFRRHDPSICEFEYSVYISADEGNATMRSWIKHVLLPFLQNSGYRIYLPMRDCLPGSIAEEECKNILQKTRCFLVILSESYLCQEGRPRTEIEWKYAWDLYLKDKHRKIVMINFDHLSASIVEPRQIKAFVRIGKVIDFGNRDGLLLENIEKAIGSDRKRSTGLANTHALFNIWRLTSRNQVDCIRQNSIT
ncbi:hypothetical protein ACJMK2_043869 [Sinanodonta woodiana]|uniref:TIR domain-containing protein n=1 Tax=Sinanodonta woodiana TaxID=1069815 RepID=A0ABD3VY87_SINWO